MVDLEMRRIKKAMAKKRKRGRMPFKSEAFTDFFYCKANFDELRLSMAEFKASENRMIERLRASL